MEKKLEDMSKLADDIVLTEQNERKLFIAYKKRIESQRRKKVLMRGYYRVAVVALAMMIMFSVNYYLQSPDLVVYAATGDKMVQLRLNERVNLEKQRTPLGYGYVLEMSVEEGSRYYTIENEQNLNADNIFRNGNKIFWMPDGMNSINFRDQDGNVIKIPETDSSIVSENPRIQKYLDQNEVFADLEIITDQNEIEKIWEENPDVKTLMKSKEYYYLAYVKGNGVRLRNTPSTSGVINGLLYETRKDWVLLNDNYSLNENYIWWQVSDSSIGCPGWIVNDYIYLSAAKSAGRAVTVPEIDFDTLKFVQ